MRIPELPGSYRPGDVVNGHVLTERGHWVPVDSPRAGNLRRRRFLSTQVSTIRDPDKPSSELSGQQARAAATAARAQHAPARGHQRPAQEPGPQQPVHQQPAPRGAVVPGSPSSATPPVNPYLSGRATPRAARGGPAPAPAPTPNRGRRGCLGCLVLVILAIGFLVPIVQGVRGFFDNLSAPEPEWSIDWDEDGLPEDEGAAWATEEPETDPGQTAPSFRLTDEEAALFEVSGWEVWHSEYSSHFVLTVAAPGLERPRVGASVKIEAVDAHGVTHEASDFVSLRYGAPTVSLGFFPEAFDAEVTELRATFTPLGVRNEEQDYEVEVLEGTVDSTAGRPWVEATIAAEGSGEPPASLRLTVVVRDADGAVRNLGIAYPSPPEPGEEALVEFPLWGPEPVSGTDDWQFTFMRQ